MFHMTEYGSMWLDCEIIKYPWIQFSIVASFFSLFFPLNSIQKSISIPRYQSNRIMKIERKILKTEKDLSIHLFISLLLLFFFLLVSRSQYIHQQKVQSPYLLYALYIIVDMPTYRFLVGIFHLPSLPNF